MRISVDSLATFHFTGNRSQNSQNCNLNKTGLLSMSTSWLEEKYQNQPHIKSKNKNHLQTVEENTRQLNKRQGLLPFTAIPEKYLRKNKKYERKIDKYVNKQSAIKTDYEKVLCQLVNQKHNQEKMLMALRKRVQKGKPQFLKKVERNNLLTARVGEKNISPLKSLENCNFPQINEKSEINQLRQLKESLWKFLSLWKRKHQNGFTTKRYNHSQGFGVRNNETVLENEPRRLSSLKKTSLKFREISRNSSENLTNKLLQVPRTEFQQYAQLCEESANFLEYFLFKALNREAKLKDQATQDRFFQSICESSHLNFSMPSDFIGVRNEQKIELLKTMKNLPTLQNQTKNQSDVQLQNKKYIKAFMELTKGKILQTVLKNAYKQLSRNQPIVLSNILKALTIEPNNQFQFITKHKFLQLRKILMNVKFLTEKTHQKCNRTLTQSSREFLLAYFWPVKGKKNKMWVKQKEICQQVHINLLKLSDLFSSEALDSFKASFQAWLRDSIKSLRQKKGMQQSKQAFPRKIMLKNEQELNFNKGFQGRNDCIDQEKEQSISFEQFENLLQIQHNSVEIWSGILHLIFIFK